MKAKLIFLYKTFSIFSIFIVLMVGYMPVVKGQTLSWTQKSNYGGGATYDPFAFVIGNKAYVGTGKAFPLSLKNDFWEYDPQTDMWTQKADFLGAGRFGARAFSIGNFGYAGTGWTPSATSSFYKYDPIANVWTQMTDFAGSDRYTGTAFSLGNFGYLGLGYTPCKDDFWRLDPVLNSWAQIASFPGGERQAASSFTINGLAYVGAGSCDYSIYQDFYKYDPSNNTWTAIAPFPGLPRSAAFSFSLGTDGYLGMGFNYPNSPSAPYTIFEDFWKYDSNNDSWIQLPDFPGGKLYEGVSFAIGNKGYVGMGSDTALAALNYVDLFWEYGLSTGINDIGNTSSSLKCYPNPAVNKLTVELNSELNTAKTQIQIYDMNGKLVKSSIIKKVTHSIELDVSNLLRGNYSLCLIQKTAVVSKCKFTKQ